jgi:8-amino-3,8-dideoxy-alpha-D-manno-octulosonate transaminase
MDICQQHNLTLVEDAGQAMGASYKGTAVGLFGKAGCYSFDFFKIATCGEGGVLVTNDEQVYRYADSYADHGHDHIGNNRGMEQHPILGFNYRISELHAAVGLAQMRKVEYIRAQNQKNKQYLTEKLAGTEGLGFAKIVDPEGDSATFLNLLFQDTETAAAFVASMSAAGVGGFNYWYTNMYHFINQWDHIKDMKTASKLAIEVLGAPQDYHNLDIPAAQSVIGRLVSFGVRCTWTDDELDLLASNIRLHAQKAVEALV